MTMKSVVWFRRDLRMEDHAALSAAVEHAAPILPVYVHTNDAKDTWSIGAASKWWLHHALEDLKSQLQSHGLSLIIRSGQDAMEILDRLFLETKADAIFWNDLYEPYARNRDSAIAKHLEQQGIQVKRFNSSLLVHPEAIANQSGAPYRVFTPFWNTLQKIAIPAPTPIPWHTFSAPSLPSPRPSAPLSLLPSIPWDTGLQSTWTPSRIGALATLHRFAQEGLGGYVCARDIPACEGTSRLSPYLHFGQLGVKETWAALGGCSNPQAFPYLRQLAWREFAHHLLYHFPHTSDAPLQTAFTNFPWRHDLDGLKQWQEGRTGYPMIDAAMRELWQTGWMHNRARMIVASFLVKDLRISWREGARWFWDTLVDADLSNNSFGWQWAGGCGADAAPYFRIFNPLLQSRKFDESGTYIRRYCPELQLLSNTDIHAPWEASPHALNAARVSLGKNYPLPVVDHDVARRSTLHAWDHWQYLSKK